MYSQSSLLVLDDVLSSLDTNTASTIVAQLFGDNGLLSGTDTTTVMTTNTSKYVHSQCCNDDPEKCRK